MCDFCKNSGENKPIYEDDIERWGIRRLSNGRWYIFHRVFRIPGARGIEISYCPICGRELREVEDDRL